MDTKTIFLVEDNPDDEALTLRALHKSSHPSQIVVARDGVEALANLCGDGTKSEQVMPYLILLDLKLPKVDGLEVLRRLRGDARTRTIPVVVFSSSNEEHDISQSYELGCNSYIRKPVDFQRFSDAVRQTVTYWLDLNIPPHVTEQAG